VGAVNPKRGVKRNQAVMDILRNLLHKLGNPTNFVVGAKT
jgi:hypothetical protein